MFKSVAKLLVVLLSAWLSMTACPALAALEISYSPYVNQSPRFSVDLPADWVAENKSESLIFSGRAGSEQWQSTVNFQFVNTEQDSLAAHVEDVKSQWRVFDPAYQLLSEQGGSLNGYPATRLEALYHDKDGVTEVRQAQFLVQYPGFICFIAYTAPSALYEKYAPVMERVLATFSMGGSIGGATSSVGPSKTAQQVLPVIEAVQLFREQNAEDGVTGWRNYVDPALEDYLKTLGEDIWPQQDVAGGWAYFFSLSMSNVGQLFSGLPVVAYYHPWSDVWLITEWAVVPEAKIVSVELLLGEWLRNRGSMPFDLTPDWLRGELYRPAALAQSIARNHRVFDRLVHGDQPWKQALQLDQQAGSALEEVNLPATSAALMASWLRAIEVNRLQPDEAELAELLDAADQFLDAGITGNIDNVLRPASGTEAETVEALKAMDAAQFADMNATYWTADAEAATLYLVPGMNSDFCLTLRYRKDAWGLNLRRVDLMFFPLLQQTIVAAEE